MFPFVHLLLGSVHGHVATPWSPRQGAPHDGEGCIEVQLDDRDVDPASQNRFFVATRRAPTIKRLPLADVNLESDAVRMRQMTEARATCVLGLQRRVPAPVAG